MTIQEFQQHILTRYGQRDKERGTQDSHIRDKLDRAAQKPQTLANWFFLLHLQTKEPQTCRKCIS